MRDWTALNDTKKITFAPSQTIQLPPRAPKKQPEIVRFRAVFLSFQRKTRPLKSARIWSIQQNIQQDCSGGLMRFCRSGTHPSPPPCSFSPPRIHENIVTSSVIPKSITQSIQRISLRRLAASRVSSGVPKQEKRNQPSPQGPKPTPGVPTMRARSIRKSKKSQPCM